jgi:uncharacterized coiled-coil DUF342 family protein
VLPTTHQSPILWMQEQIEGLAEQRDVAAAEVHSMTQAAENARRSAEEVRTELGKLCADLDKAKEELFLLHE